MTGLMRKSLTVCTYSTNDLLKASRVFKEGLDSKKIVSNTQKGGGELSEL